jgi:hypothetical protein
VCTLSFLPAKDGYLAAMNRDEQRARPAALPPTIRKNAAFPVLYPQEPGGGTWIGANARGNLLALLNWYAKEPGQIGQKKRSRGEIIPAIVAEGTAESTRCALQQVSLAGLFPFRLFGFFPAERLIHEWRWDTQALVVKCYSWRRHHWFSSSCSDQKAAAQRGAACQQAGREDLGDLEAWLRKLHASHHPEPGPFSLCVHRKDTATVSYTEVRYDERGLQMRYQAGNPCQTVAGFTTAYLPALPASSNTR